MRSWLLMTATAVLLMSGYSVQAWEVSPLQPFSLDAKGIDGASDLSGVALVGGNLAVVSDEGNAIFLLSKNESGTYALLKKYRWSAGILTEEREKILETGSATAAEQSPELDLEGVAVSADYLYVIGSHSAKRKKVDLAKDTRKRSTNRNRLHQVTAEESRRVVFRQRITEDGLLEGPSEVLDLWRHITDQDGILEIFSKIPAKENGVDIEAVAVRGNKLYAGFRGPVLTGNWVPVLVSSIGEGEEEADLLFLHLQGLGIRDMVFTGDGFLLIAGPVGDGPGGYQLYHWDGKDCLPGKKGSSCHLQMIMEIPSPAGAKAEGITVLARDEQQGLHLLLLYDGPEGGSPVTFWLKR